MAMDNITSDVIIEGWQHLERTVVDKLVAKRFIGESNGLEWWCVYAKDNNLFGMGFDTDNILNSQNLGDYHFLKVETYDKGGTTILVISIKDVEFKQEFASLCSYLIEPISSKKTNVERIKVLLRELARWEKMFSRIKDYGLTPTEQRGLFGELVFLEDSFLSAGKSKSELVTYWEGPGATPRDFQGNNWAVEVKTSIKNTPRIVHINGERQLDNSLFVFLGLFYCLLDKSACNGLSLPEMVEKMRNMLASDCQALKMYENKLFMLGYRDRDASKYDAKYRIREKLYFNITDNFPKISERILPSAISDVSYTLNLDACYDWGISRNSIFDIIHKY